jgi:hypothetical protein
MPMRYKFHLLLLAALAIRCAAAQDANAVDRLLDRIVQQERTTVDQLLSHTPLIETYIQETIGNPETDERANRDHYFLGRLGLANGLNYTPIAARPEAPKSSRLSFLKSKPVTFVPAGFAQMIFIDATSLSREHYRFEYVRREFLGDLRSLIFDVAPIDPKAEGRFIGRIWVDDKDFAIVRFNGTYTKSRSGRRYFHFDSWRMNIGPKHWVPAFIYVEESGEARKGSDNISFKAQTRVWGYQLGQSRAAR